MKTFNIISKFFVSLLLLGSFAVSGWGESPDAGDKCSEATAVDISAGTATIIGESESNDKDFYKITIPKDGILTVTTSSPNSHKYYLAIGSTCSDGSETGKEYYTVEAKEVHSVLPFHVATGTTVYFYLKETGSDTDEYKLNLTLADTASSTQDICYDPVQTQGVSMFGIGMFYGVTIPLRNVSGNALSDVTIIKSFNGIDMSMMSKIKLDGTEKTPAQDTDNAEIDQALSTTFGSFSMSGMFDKGIVYYPDGDGAFSAGQTHTIYDYSMFSFSWANVSLNALYTKDGVYYVSQIEACGGGGGEIPLTYSPGVVDVVDTYQSTVGTPFYQAVIKTKIAGKTDMTLDAVYLGSDLKADAVYNAADMPVFMYIYYPLTNTVTRLYNQNDLNEPLAAVITKGSISGTTPSFTVPPVAAKEAYILMKYLDYEALITAGGPTCLNSSTEANAVPGMPSCVASNDQYKTAFGQEAYDRCKVQHGQPCNPEHHGFGDFPYDHKYGCYECTLGATPLVRSVDNFAIRPYAFRVFGSNEYKRAGEDFNITIKAVDETNNALNSGTVDGVNGVDDYNASLSDLKITSMFYTPTTDEMTRMQTNTGTTDVAICPNSGTFTLTNPSSLFIDGEQNATLKFNETGILDLYISENIGHEWAIVDADDTSDSNRTISPSINSFDKTDISENTILAFVPYGFVTTADYNTTTGADWIYMHNINGSNSTFTTPKMGAYLSYSITAKGKDGNVLQNYTKTCFPDTSESRPYNASTDCPQVNGLKLNTTFDLYLNANINSSADANISLYTEDNASSAIYTPQKNVTLAKGSNAIQEWTSPKTFTNGVGKAKVYFNIDRKANVALNPITLRVEDVNTSTSWMANPGSPKDFNGTILNTPKNFVYGRTHAAKQRYIKPSGTNTTTGTANIYFESYCFGAGCNKTLLPNNITSKRIDDLRWFWNENHIVPADGVAGGTVSQKGGLGFVTATTPTAANPSITTLNYNGNKGYPYKTTMENGASPWLIYNESDPTATRNEFQVEFNSGADWSGAHDTNTTTKTDQAIRTNRRIMW